MRSDAALNLAHEARPRVADPAFRRRVAKLAARHRHLWRAAGDDDPQVGPRVGAWRRLRNGRATRRLIDELAERLESFPEEPHAAARWQRELRERIQTFGERRFGWPTGYRSLAFGDDFYQSTRDFVRRAREFDPAIRFEDVGQAMRNVWIVNSLQMILEQPVELTPAAFAYSMLYPYTDNLLDDPALPAAVKRGMNERLGRWLEGREAEPNGDVERRIRRLVAIVEEQYPRHRYEAVFEGLLAIHRGQIRSLWLQQPGPAPARGEILAVQIEKGGASVLADGYLVRGWLEPAEEDFCFGYGVFLQLLDDLQDAATDREAGHATLFSIDAGRRPLDRLAGRLWSYMNAVVEGAVSLDGPRFADRRDLILRNCTVLMVSAIAESPDLFSRRFRRAIGRRWPLRLGSMRSLRRFGRRRLRAAHAELARRRGVESAWELLTEG